MEQIVIKNLSKSYGTLTVLKNVDLTLDRYKTYCLVSPSGTGKTTLFRILMGPSCGLFLPGRICF